MSKTFSTPKDPLDAEWNVVKLILSPIASLKLTVFLFALSILLIFVSTLAQYKANMWQVIDHYYHSLFAWVPFDVFLPQSFFPNRPENIPGGFYMPGGILIGSALALNLAAAHLVRFKTQAKGSRLLIGLAVMGLGVLITAMIVASGHNGGGLQGALLFGYGKLDPSMRILWQLVQGLVAGVVLLIGAVMVFRKRGGIVVIHLGVGLLMFGEMLVGLYNVEEQMAIIEGQTLNFARDTRTVELVVIDRSNPEFDEVISIPKGRLRAGKTIKDKRLPFDIEIEEFMDHCVLREIKKDDVNPATSGNGTGVIIDPARGAAGAEAGGEIDVAGMYAKITPKDDPQAGETYLLSQHFGDSDLLTVASLAPDPERILVKDKFYDVMLRYKRNYKDYSVTLNDVRKEDYIGTSTPRDYSSYISLVDESRDFSDDNIRIWMNNPLRYAGETFYQSGYTPLPDGKELSTIQIVKNTGWMIPYVACMLAWVGLMYHFAQVLFRFLDRRSRETNTVPVATPIASVADETDIESEAERLSRGQLKRKQGQPGSDGIKPQPVSTQAEANTKTTARLIAIAIGILCLIYVGGKLRSKEIEHEGMRLDRFADIPVVYGGRVKPIDTLARNAMRAVSDKQKLSVPDPDNEKKLKKKPALVWFLDTITLAEKGRDHRVFRIENLDVLETLGLTRRKGFLYSANEIADGIEEFEEEVDRAKVVAADDAAKLTYQQRKLLDTAKRIREYMKIQNSFMPIPIPARPTEEEEQADPAAAAAKRQDIIQRLAAIPRMNETLMAMEPPLVVPLTRGDQSWKPYAAARNAAALSKVMSREQTDPRVRQWNEMLRAYALDDATGFNRAVTAYLKGIQSDPPKDYDQKRIAFERKFNDFQPFVVGMVFYIVAFLLTLISWILGVLVGGLFRPFRNAGMAIILVALLVHTGALVARIYISGRPPVTNLYSSAVFIGWFAVLAGVVVEYLLDNGFGNILSSVIGFSTLIIAHNLAFGGDTFTVLQAVLDTQFWLATHVVTITLGYGATLLAGSLAVMYVGAGVFVPQFDKASRKAVSGVIYGILCFAIFLSFIGTVLGGLWADDSWGRFWGWDPKENGALMIVLWNAIILHARWGKMVRERGMAVLAIFGMIVTAWSWFGVNELGIGLHSYGFTEGVLPALATFAICMLGVMGVGLLPTSMWLSHQSETKGK